MTNEEILWRYKIQDSGTGPLIIEIDEPQMIVGMFVMPEGILGGSVPDLVALFPFVEDAAQRGQGVIVLPSPENIASIQVPQCVHWPRGTYKMIRRHEMTHWIRWRQKKFVYAPKKTFWAALMLFREEIIAYRSQVRVHAPEAWASALENSSAGWWFKAWLRTKGKKVSVALRTCVYVDVPFALFVSMTKTGVLGERLQRLCAHLQRVTLRIGAYFTRRRKNG